MIERTAISTYKASGDCGSTAFPTGFFLYSSTSSPSLARYHVQEGSRYSAGTVIVRSKSLVTTSAPEECGYHCIGTSL